MRDLKLDITEMANNFTKRLYQCCESCIDTAGLDQSCGNAKKMISVLYAWLFETRRITAETSFSDVCNAVNSTAIYFFTLDMESCSESTKQRWVVVAQEELALLESRRELVLSDFKVIFDLTCAGAFLGDDEGY